MRKRDELTNPNSCMSRARDDEITFVLLERDAASPKTIRYWIRERIKMGLNQPGDPQMADAEQCAQAIETERLLSTQNVLSDETHEGRDVR